VQFGKKLYLKLSQQNYVSVRHF